MTGLSAIAMTALLLLAAPLAHAQEQAKASGQDEPHEEPKVDSVSALRQRLGLRGSVRSGLWSASRSLDDRGPLFGTSIWTELAPRLGSRARLFFDGWIGVDDVWRADDVAGEVREAYVDARFGRVDLRAGKQIIAWGRADGVNPTDNLTPRDLTLLVSEDDDQRTGVPALRATAHMRSVSVTGLWLAQFTGDTLPLPSSSGVQFRRVKPKSEDELRQLAIKVERVGGSLDGSLSYFTGLDQLPDVAAAGAAALTLQSHRIHVIGGDLAAVLGRVGVRAEAAYTRTEDRRGDRPEIKNPTFFIVGGVDRTFREYFYVNVQYAFRVVQHYRAPDDSLDEARRNAALLLAVVSHQGRRYQQGMTMKVSNKWRHETLEAEVSGVVYARPGQGALRSKISCALTDRWRVIVGGELLRGEPQTLFDLFRNASSVYAEVRFGF